MKYNSAIHISTLLFSKSKLISFGKLKLLEVDFKYLFLSIIQRVYYFVTVNSVNVNENSLNFIEPTIDDFNDVVKAFVTVLAF